MPQELARLTTLTYLSLLRNAAKSKAVAPLKMAPHGRMLVPKMRVTPQHCRFLLQFPRLVFLHLTVTEEEKAALTAGLLTKLERVRNGAIRVSLDISEDFILSNE